MKTKIKIMKCSVLYSNFINIVFIYDDLFFFSGKSRNCEKLSIQTVRSVVEKGTLNIWLRLYWIIGVGGYLKKRYR